MSFEFAEESLKCWLLLVGLKLTGMNFNRSEVLLLQIPKAQLCRIRVGGKSDPEMLTEIQS